MTSKHDFQEEMNAILNTPSVEQSLGHAQALAREAGLTDTGYLVIDTASSKGRDVFMRLALMPETQSFVHASDGLRASSAEEASQKRYHVVALPSAFLGELYGAYGGDRTDWDRVLVEMHKAGDAVLVFTRHGMVGTAVERLPEA